MRSNTGYATLRRSNMEYMHPRWLVLEPTTQGTLPLPGPGALYVQDRNLPSKFLVIDMMILSIFL